MANLNDIQKKLEHESNKRPENKDNKRNKVERVPFGTPRGKLDVRGKEPGYVYAWVNDDKVDARIEEGFELVIHPVQVGTRNLTAQPHASGTCVTLPVGAGVTGYLMRIPEEFYKEDMDRYNAYVNSTEETMRKQLKNNSLTGNLEISRNNRE